MSYSGDAGSVSLQDILALDPLVMKKERLLDHPDTLKRNHAGS